MIAMRAEDDSSLRVHADSIRAEKSDGSFSIVHLHASRGGIGAGESAVGKKNGNLAVVGRILVDHVGGNIAEEQITALAHPNRPFQKAETLGNFFDFGVRGNNVIELGAQPRDEIPVLRSE